MNSILVHLFCPCLPVLCRYGCYPFDRLSVIVEHTCPIAEVRRPYSNCWGRQHNFVPCSSCLPYPIYNFFLSFRNYHRFLHSQCCRLQRKKSMWQSGMMVLYSLVWVTCILGTLFQSWTSCTVKNSYQSSFARNVNFFHSLTVELWHPCRTKNVCRLEFCWVRPTRFKVIDVISNIL